MNGCLEPGWSPGHIRSSREVGSRDERIARAAEARHHRGAIGLAREVDPEAIVGGGVGREDQREQALLVAAEDGAGEVEEVVGLEDSVPDHADTAALLDDEVHRAVARIRHDRQRHRESGDERLGP